MSIELHHSSVIDQYASDNGIIFYQHVMGAGAPVIHYGIYQNQDDDMIAATQAATLSLLEHAQQLFSVPPLRILELGSGLGGSAHMLARETGADVQCVDLCSRLNRHNEETAEELNLKSQVTTWTGSYEDLPEEWSESFDLVWSQEAFCHAFDHVRVFEEAHRCLKPGGVLAFSDIMLSNSVSEEDAKTYSSVNVISKWSNIDDTLADLGQAGFAAPVTQDWSQYLPENFSRMLYQIRENYDELVRAGVEQDFIQGFEKSLEARLKWPAGEVLCWHAVAAEKVNT